MHKELYMYRFCMRQVEDPDIPEVCHALWRMQAVAWLKRLAIVQRMEAYRSRKIA